MAGIDLTGDRRSQLLEILLAQQNQKRQRPIRSGGELAARLGAQLIRQQGINQLQGEEAVSQQQLVEALQAGQATPPSAVTLEGIEGAFGREQVAIPGKKAVPSERMAAIQNLDPAQQIAAMQLMAGQRELADPTAFKQKQILQTQGEKAQAARQEELIESQERQTEMRIESAEERLDRTITSEERMLGRRLDADELKQIRGIQAESELLDKKINAEIEAAQGAGGDFKSSQWIAAGYGVRAEDAGAVIGELEEKFSRLTARGGLNPFRSLKSADRQRFEQAKRNFINAQLRRESGAVISDQEFANADEQYFPKPGEKPASIKQKARNRQVVIEALRGEAAGAYDQLKARLGATENTATPTSSFTEGQTATGPNGEKVVYRNGEWVSQ